MPLGDIIIALIRIGQNIRNVLYIRPIGVNDNE